ncbi:hypothetical protein FCM35_KLT09769 [Carex littledalei]|uniref:Myb-like domain-containing protein n=1 Tax=Carex littledalei TaxID=544730 RepID=A0A833R1Z0_9POAL|nr:hypothetical protein FCM35_KLT09769 [Carex littledalei]
MAKRPGVASKNSAATPLRKSSRFKTQNPNQSISSSHREPLSSHQSDLKSTPSSAKPKRSNSGKKIRIECKQTCAPSVSENVVEKDTVLGSDSARRRSSRLAKIGTIGTAQDGVCAPKKRDCMVTKLSGNVAKKDTVVGSDSARRSPRLAKISTTSAAQDGVCARKKRDCMVTKLEVEETCLQSVCDIASDKVAVSGSVNNLKRLPKPGKVCTASMVQRRSPRLASSDTTSNNLNFEITKKSTRSSKSNKHIRPACPPNVQNNSSQNNCIKEPSNNSLEGRRSHRLAVLSDKLESNCSEGEIDRDSQQFPPIIQKNASKKVAMLAAKPPLPPNQRRSKQIENQSDEITSKDIKSKYAEESDSDYKCEDTPVGKKRKRQESAETEAPVEFGNVELDGGLDGWTGEQEIALRNAFFLARPSPHFWKKVSKMVPGKNAQECFNRIHSNFATPPSIPCKTRLNKGSQMDSPLKKFNLLEPNSPKARKVSKQKKTRDARKTVRHLLKKQQLVDQVQDADYFSQFEGSPVNLPSDVKLPRDFSCEDRLNSDPEIKLKPGSSQNQPDLSPAVLKPVKNMELHEKYIDHLHCVDARRKACVRACGNKGKEIDLGTKAGELKDAKTALVSEAQDFIGCFKKLQGDPFGDCALSEEDDEFVL